MSEFTFHFPTPSTPVPTDPQSKGGNYNSLHRAQRFPSGFSPKLATELQRKRQFSCPATWTQVCTPAEPHYCCGEGHHPTSVTESTRTHSPPMLALHTRGVGVGCSTWRKSLPVSEISAVLERRDWRAHGLRNCDRASTASCHVCPQI